MQVVFDAPLPVHYGFAYFSALFGDEPSDDLDVAFRGQQNGICGAAVPHRLTLMIGTHTGDVPLRVEWHEVAPALDGQWQDVVEVPFEAQTQAAQVSAFEDYLDVTMPAVGPHRARFCAIGMDAAQEPVEEEPGEDDPPPDRYLLQFWPAPMTSDEIVRVGTERAQYWHDVFGGNPPLAAGELHAIRAAQEAAASQLIEEGDSFLTLKDDADLDVIGDLLALAPATQHETARWLARETVEMAGLAGDPSFAAALDALDAGRPLLAPFDDFGAAAARALNTTPATEDTLVETVNDPEPDDDFGWHGSGMVDESPGGDRRQSALHAVIALDAAAGSDPARAVVLAYRSAFAADDTGDRLDRELSERLGHSPD